MKNRLNIILAALAVATAVGAPVLALNKSELKEPAGHRVNLSQGEDRLWSFSGTARYVDDYTGKEDYMSVHGLVTASSRGEALELARESGRAQAARRGTVVSVNIRSIF